MIAIFFLNLDVSIESLYNWFNIGCSQLKVLSVINAADPYRYRWIPLGYYNKLIKKWVVIEPIRRGNETPL